MKELDELNEKCVQAMKDVDAFVDGFSIGFTTDDLSTSMRGGKVNVTARVSKEDFDKIIYSYGVYILDYLSEKGLIKNK